ncbi:MAG: DotA/TraY family protein [Gammaproteobacteria bacterium]|nr:DotA/TraY family protein [Gammaproteobacteria bacterium]
MNIKSYSFSKPHKMRILSFILICLMSLFFCQVTFAQDQGNSDSTFRDYFQIAPKDASKDMIQNIFGQLTLKTLQEEPQTIIAAMFKDFNHALLVLAIIVIIYTLLLSLVGTAASGQFLISGKKASIWLPLRTVTGIALILPTPSGYSVIQVFFMWVVMQGIGAADSLWNATLNYLEQPTSATIIAPVKPYIAEEKQIVLSTLAASICRQRAANYLYESNKDQGFKQGQSKTQKFDYTGDGYLTNIPERQTVKTDIQTSDGKTQKVEWSSYNYDVNQILYAKVPAGLKFTKTPPFVQIETKNVEAGDITIPCGGLAFRQQNSGEDDQENKKFDILNNHMPQIIDDLNGVARDYAKANTDEERQNAVVENGVNIIEVAAQQLHNDLQDAANAYIKEHHPTINKEVFKDAKDYGWAYAGGYYYSIARLNNRLSKIVQLGGDTIQVPNRQTMLGKNFPFYTGQDESLLTDLLTTGPKVGPRFTFGVSPTATGQSAQFGAAANDTLNSVIPMISSLLTGKSNISDPLDGFFADPDVNPIIKLQTFGNTLTYNIFKLLILLWVTYFSMYTIGLAAGMLPFVGGIATAISSILNYVLLTFIMPLGASLIALLGVAFMMSTYMPLVPFLIFTFTMIGWLIGVVETMLAAPIVALGLTHPEGHEVLGRADTAIQLITNMFLRPSFMIFGLISGMVVSTVAVDFFTQIYSFVVGDIVSTSPSGANLIQVFLYLAVYVGTIITILNKSYSLIHVFPDRILSWLGWQSQFGRYGMEEDKVEGYFTGAAGGIGSAAGAIEKKVEEGRAKMEKGIDEGKAKPPERAKGHVEEAEKKPTEEEKKEDSKEEETKSEAKSEETEKPEEK